MRWHENEKLRIQTSDSSSIIVTREEFPYDSYEEGDSDLRYSISEGNNPLYWCDCWHKDFESIIAILEMPPRDSCNRDHISWWLNFRPAYIDESVSEYLRERLLLYHKFGEIVKAFRYSRFGLEGNPDCLLLWHKLLAVQFDPKLLNLIPNDRVGYVETPSITIIFDGFNNLPYKSFNLKLLPWVRFQHVLDYIFGCIKSSVTPLSYGTEWILVNLRSGKILKKVFYPAYKIDNRTLNLAGIQSGDKLICTLV